MRSDTARLWTGLQVELAGEGSTAVSGMLHTCSMQVVTLKHGIYSLAGLKSVAAHMTMIMVAKLPIHCIQSQYVM